MHFSHGTGASKGVAILFKQNVHKTIHNCITDKEGIYVVLDIELDDIRCTLVNLYSPNEDEPEFFIELVQTIDALPNDHRIVGGDFLFLSWTWIWTSMEVGKQQKSTLKLSLKIGCWGAFQKHLLALKSKSS